MERLLCPVLLACVGPFSRRNVSCGDRVTKRLTLALALSIFAATWDTAAQTGYPEQTVRILVGFSPGVAPDVAARLLASPRRRRTATPSAWSATARWYSARACTTG